MVFRGTFEKKGFGKFLTLIWMHLFGSAFSFKFSGNCHVLGGNDHHFMPTALIYKAFQWCIVWFYTWNHFRISQLILRKISNNLHWINTISGPVLDSIVYDAAPHTCAPHQCSQDAQIIEAYNVGKIYEYDYVVDSIAEMRSASPSKESKLNMAARVKVQVLTPCEFSVKVSLI